MVDQEIVERVFQRLVFDARVDTGREEPLERGKVHAVGQRLWHQRRENGLARNADMQSGEIAVCIQCAADLGFRRRVEEAVHHVLFARPLQLHRSPRHLLRDFDSLADIVRHAPAAESATKEKLVNVALLNRQLRCASGGCKRGFTVLGGAPDFALLGSPDRRGVHRLHRRMVLERHVIGGFDHFGRIGEGRGDVPHLVAGEGIVGCQAIIKFGLEFGAGKCHAALPFHVQGEDGLVGAPPGISDHGDRVVAHLHHLLDPGHGHDSGCVKALHLGANLRRLPDRGRQHAVELDIRAVNLCARELVGGVEAQLGLADNRPVLRILERYLKWRRELCRCRGELAIGQRLL